MAQLFSLGSTRTSNNKHKQIPMKKQVVRISILQSSKIVTAIQFLLGFIYTLLGVFLIVFAHNPGLKTAGVIYLFMPIIMPILGFIFFIIIAAIYNFLAKQFGGIEVEVRDVDHAA